MCDTLLKLPQECSHLPAVAKGISLPLASAPWVLTAAGAEDDSKRDTWITLTGKNCSAGELAVIHNGTDLPIASARFQASRTESRGLCTSLPHFLTP